MKAIVTMLVLCFNFIAGAWSVVTILSWFGKDIGYLLAGVVGIFVAEFSVPIAIVGEILKIAGVF